ncbi:hypothetical protein DFH08DRAFT_732498 [Mycena albidolilacea]|uniref:F-box domain-containing protein n=1 Tax=Mycena albidolilacea TaxID=1033008 RepID=A0AAD7AKC7_9AGAR|nr:hypothetical protein DFH08DRAFT_732498 [Mycena albidolilacea]
MTSLVLSRFRTTNDPPFEQEALEVRGIHDMTWRALHALEGQSPAVSAETRQRRDSESLHQTIELCRSILSPLRRIPPEILAHIFLLSLPSISDTRNEPWDIYLERSPWVLTHVSRRWRAVALASPALWCRIIIRSTDISDDSEICSLPMLAAQLARSGKSPLEIIFDYETFNDKSGGDVAQEALQTLARHSARWKILRITASQFMQLSSVRGWLPLLEHLSVWGRCEETDDDGSSPPPPEISHFATAPRLRYVEVDDGFPAFDLPWAQLTRYEARGLWSDHISALMHLKNAELCSFIIADEPDLEDTSGSHIVELPKLRQLQVSTEQYHQVIEKDGVWSKCLRVPGLKELAIPDGLLQDLPSLQQVSRFSLTKLHIVSGCPVAEAFRPVLECNPEISELLVSMGYRRLLGRDLIALLTPDGDPTPQRPGLLPKLETLVLRHPPRIHEDAIGNMIALRWSATPLRSVHAVEIGPVLTDRLNRLEKEGLNVFVRSTKSRMLQNNYGDYESPFQLD